MGRPWLTESSGMLFIFPDEDVVRMWMKDTVIPLSVAFLDRDGRVLNIEEMRPLTLEPHASRSAARFALEMDAGWFARHHVAPGLQVGGLPAADTAR